MKPLVSVIVTTYNQASYIGAALRSVFDQTYTDFEVIVVDDGSTDDTPARIKPLVDRLRFIRQNNGGVASSRNTGMRHAKGELLAFLDGDDLWTHEKLSVQVAAAMSHPQSGLIAVNGVQFGEPEKLHDSLIGQDIKPHLGEPGSSVTLQCYEKFLQQNQIFTTSQIMIPKNAIDAIGLSDTSLRLCSDWDLYLRIARKYEMTFVNTALTWWRYLDTSASGPDYLRELNWGPEIIQILKRQLREGPAVWHPLIRRLIRQRILEITRQAYYYGRKNDRGWAMRYLVKLLAKNPTSTAVVASLIALSCPQSLTRRLAPIARRVLRS